jgi:hypothetical protein
MNLTVIWEQHKKFILGVGAAAVFVGLFYMFFIKPANSKAETAHQKAARAQKKLKALFLTPPEQHPTEGLKRKYEALQGELGSLEAELIQDLSFPVEPPYVLPGGERNFTAYFVDIQGRAKDEVKNLSDLNAIELKAVELGFDRPPSDKEECTRALGDLATVRRACLAAIDAGVSSIDKVILKTGKERSMQVHDRRLEERVIAMEVRGTPSSVLRWMKNLQRRGAFLLVVSADIARVKEGEDVKGTVEFAALQIRRVERSEEDEDEEESGGTRRW